MRLLEMVIGQRDRRMGEDRPVAPRNVLHPGDDRSSHQQPLPTSAGLAPVDRQPGPSQPHVDGAGAGAAQTPPCWQYKVTRIGGETHQGPFAIQRMENLLDELGAQGWELVAINDDRATLKRPLPVT